MTELGTEDMQGRTVESSEARFRGSKPTKIGPTVRPVNSDKVTEFASLCTSVTHCHLVFSKQQITVWLCLSVTHSPHCGRAGIGEKKLYLPLTALTTAFLVLASALAAALPFALVTFSALSFAICFWLCFLFSLCISYLKTLGFDVYVNYF